MGELGYHWRTFCKALMSISMFFKDGLESFEVNRNVQISSKKSGLRIDAETTANRLLEGRVFDHFSVGYSVTVGIVIARQTPMLEELSGPSNHLFVSSGNAMC